jgi:type I site-specific restriction endonuclease
VLFAKPNIPIAIVEAKDNKHAVGDGTQQAITYAKMLRVTTAGTTSTRLLNALLHEALTPATPIPEAAE